MILIASHSVPDFYIKNDEFIVNHYIRSNWQKFFFDLNETSHQEVIILIKYFSKLLIINEDIITFLLIIFTFSMRSQKY